MTFPEAPNPVALDKVGRKWPNLPEKHCYSFREDKRSGARHFHRLLGAYSASKPGEIAESVGYSQVPGTLTARRHQPPKTGIAG